MSERVGRPRLGGRRGGGIDELIGICRGVLADGVLVTEEAEFLLHWMQDRREVADQWPANALYQRIAAALEDGSLTADEEGSILDALMAITRGDEDCRPEDVEDSGETIAIVGRSFCLTGEFVSGTRANAEAGIVASGGRVVKTPTRATDFLVVGDLGSPAWVGGTYGRKIETARELRRKGFPIAIVREARWWAALQEALP